MNNKTNQINNIENFSLDYSPNNKLESQDYLNYTTLIKYNYESLVTIINNFYNEEDKITLLRNEEFINLIPSYTLEMILNNMFFNSVFNMLQNKNIYDKINCIDVNISPKDYLLIPGYLDSENLINKTSHLMLTDLLLNVSTSSIKEYLNKPYIINKLNNEELILIAGTNNINIMNILITRNTNEYEMTQYINKMWEKRIDYILINNDYVKSNILKLSNEQIKDIDFNEVFYLFDRLKTYGVITVQESPITINTLKSVIAAYQVLGLKDFLSFVENGSKNILISDIKKVSAKIVDYELYLYQLNNANTFDNITGKVLNELDNISKYRDLNDLINNSPYLRNIISLSRIYNYGDTVAFISDYLTYEQEYGNVAKSKLYKYFNGLTKHIYQNQKSFKQDQVKKSVLQFLQLKPATIYSHKNKLTKEHIKFLKIKILISTLIDDNKNKYQNLYKYNIDINNITEMYLKCIGKSNFNINEIINSILLPISKNTFNYEDTLLKLKIKIPNQLNLIIEEKNERRLISKLNKEIIKLLSDSDDNEKINILNYLCYGTELYSKANIKTWANIRKELLYLNGNVFVNKEEFKIDYQNNLIVDNIENVTTLKEIIAEIDLIIKHTYSFINRVIETTSVENIYKDEINNYISSIKNSFKLNSRNYEVKKNVFCLNNIENAFNGFEISKSFKADDNFKKLFIENNLLAYAAIGLFNKYYDSFGQILSNYPEYSNNDNNDIVDYLEWLRKKNNQNNPLIQSLDNSYQSKLAFDDKTSLKLYEQIQKKIYATIPQIKGYTDKYYFETCDFHSTDLITNNYPEIFNNYQLHEYLCTNKNGCYINIYDTISNIQIGNIAVIRNGNTIYLSKLNMTKQNIAIDQIIKAIANELIEQTSNGKEPIDFVLFNTLNIDCLPNYIKVNEQLISNLNNPIIDGKNINDYNSATSLLIASNKALNKHNIRNYNPEIIYSRNRSHYKIMSNFASLTELNKINLMLYYSLNDKEQYTPFNINDFKEIIYGDDWFIIKRLNDTLETFNFSSDEQADNEIKEYLNKVQQKTKSKIKVA